MFVLEGIQNFRNKTICPYQWFDHPDKMHTTELPPFDAFYSKLRSCNHLEAKYTDNVSLLKSGLTTEQAVIKLKQSKPTRLGIEIYQQIWQEEKRAHSSSSCGGITIKMLSQLWTQCKK